MDLGLVPMLILGGGGGERRSQHGRQGRSTDADIGGVKVDHSTADKILVPMQILGGESRSRRIYGKPPMLQP